MPSEYQNFVKKQMASMRGDDMKATDKMKHIAKLWQKTKDTYTNSSEDSSSEDEAPRKPRKPVKKSDTTKQKTNKDIDLSELLELIRK